ncbi:metal-dependent hydrolase [Methylomarinum sp. Ch1-1]|uniref:Metal-dependent hydrolase n=1 Tax=Methylomarinum roseum TaxID=3067653 RepID=A0AAU7NS05_9GAMM
MDVFRRMANFNTHVGVATTASTAAATTAANLGLIELIDAPWYIFIGVIGGMLPDIDADNSTPVKRLFMLLAGLSSAGAWVVFENLMAPQRLMLLAVVTFFVVRYPVFFLFQKLTVHRGVFHSLLAAFFFGLLTTCGSHYILGWNILQSWLNGLFLVIGFVVHLCLDELFSVDLANGRMKKSFGTAFKLFSYKNMTASVLLFISVVALFIVAPPYSHLLQVWQRLHWVKTEGSC